MGNSCVDVCDAVLSVMCVPCPHYKKCQNMEDECNHDQMLSCMGSLKMSEYPKEGDYTPLE